MKNHVLPKSALDLIELMNVMAQFTPVPPLQPARPVMPADPAGLAKAAAESAKRIAAASAALGTSGNDAGCAQTIWQETLLQIERVQTLHGLPKMPFQRQLKLLPKAGAVKEEG